MDGTLHWLERAMSNRFRSILVAVDTSPRAQGVLQAAADLAQLSEGKLVLFRAVGLPLEVPPEALSKPPEALAEILEAKARKGLEALARTLPPALVAKVKVRVGTPWEAITHAAKEEDVDLVVIGSHGFSAIDRLLGTTAARVVNHADRCVLVVRDPVPGAGAKGSAP